jgi:hypothetical protein
MILPERPGTGPDYGWTIVETLDHFFRKSHRTTRNLDSVPQSVVERAAAPQRFMDVGMRHGPLERFHRHMANVTLECEQHHVAVEAGGCARREPCDFGTNSGCTSPGPDAPACRRGPQLRGIVLPRCPVEGKSPPLPAGLCTAGNVVRLTSWRSSLPR